MAQSYKILSVLGIDIELHISFIIFIAVLLFIDLQLALILSMVFIFVTIHELFHSMVAIKNKIKVKKIMLIPIGGVAMMDATEVKPLIEIKMALAGPMFNFLMCYILLALMLLFNMPLMGIYELLELGISAELFFYYAFYVNLILGTFNLFLPAFPLDGGRVFRAALVCIFKVEYVKATLVARNVSLVTAGFIAIIALMMGDIWILIICAFIIFGALAEYQGLLIHRSLSRIRVRDVLSKSYVTVTPRKKVIDSIEKLLEKGSMSALVKYRTTVKVADIRSIAEFDDAYKQKVTFDEIAVKVPKATLRTNVEKMVKAMSETKVSMIPVYDRGRLIGVVKRIDVERLRTIKEMMS